MSDAPERIWATRLNEPQRKHAWGDWDDTEQTDGVEYIRADHVNELVAAAYEKGVFSAVNRYEVMAGPDTWDFFAMARNSMLSLLDFKSDAAAALAARDARVREAALREAANVAADYGNESYAAKMISSAIEDLIEEAKEPDFCYNRQDWQSTFGWKDRDILVEDMLVGDVMEVGTLFRGPTRWVVEYENSNGDRETSWFDNEADARALAEKDTTNG